MRIGVVIGTIGRETLVDTIKRIYPQPYDFLIVARDYLGNLALKRNEAISKLDVDIIAITDDDTLPKPDWISQGRDFFQKNNVGIMQGGVTGGIKTSETFLFVGANLWFKKSVWEAVGGFDERFLGIGGNEDLDFCWTALNLGIKYAYNPSCSVYHPTKPKHGVFAGNERLLELKHPERYRLLKEENIA